MDFTLLFKTIGPTLISLLGNASGALKTDAPITGSTVAVPSRGASSAIKDLQVLLNTVLELNPPLEADGWLGKKTEAAIQQGIAKLKTFGIG